MPKNWAKNVYTTGPIIGILKFLITQVFENLSQIFSICIDNLSYIQTANT